jgi:hypothetical protein
VRNISVIFILLLCFRVFVFVLVLELAEFFRAFFCRRDSEGFLFVVVEIAGVACPLALGNKVSLNLEREKLKQD